MQGRTAIEEQIGQLLKEARDNMKADSTLEEKMGAVIRGFGAVANQERDFDSRWGIQRMGYAIALSLLRERLQLQGGAGRAMDAIVGNYIDDATRHIGGERLRYSLYSATGLAEPQRREPIRR